MKYNEALLWLHSVPRFAKNPELGRFRRFLKELGNPQEGLEFFHVAGTNGKGSVSAMIASILIAAGLKTGLYTSPELEDFAERIAVDSKKIDRESFVRLTGLLRSAYASLAEKGLDTPIQFELFTALALLYFAERKCDVVVFETGLGGRFDATNVVTPLVSVITTIGLDHVAILGTTLSEIAYEKAGIIKPGAPVVTGVTHPEALKVISHTAKERGSAIVTVGLDADVRWSERHSGLDGQTFDVCGEDFSHRGLRLSLLGKHQMQNAAVAVAAVETARRVHAVPISKAAVSTGLCKLIWPGRLEVLHRNPTVILDAAHNPQGARALSETLVGLGAGKIVAVVGVLNDRLHDEVARILAQIASVLITTTPLGSRATKAQDLAATLDGPAEILVEDSIERALDRAFAIASSADTIVICGSFQLIGPARSILKKRFSENER